MFENLTNDFPLKIIVVQSPWFTNSLTWVMFENSMPPFVASNLKVPYSYPTYSSLLFSCMFLKNMLFLAVILQAVVFWQRLASRSKTMSPEGEAIFSTIILLFETMENRLLQTTQIKNLCGLSADEFKQGRVLLSPPICMFCPE